MSTKSGKAASNLDRIAAIVALAAILLGGFVVYSRSAPTSLAATVESMARASFLLPEELHGQDIEFETDYYGHRYKGNTKNLIDAYVLYYGAWEKHILYFLRDAAEALGGEDLVFVDVGANSGLHSIFMSSYAKAVHAIEPYPPAVERITEAVSHNGLGNLFVHPVGFGDQDATLPFSAPDDENFGIGSFNENADENGLRLHIVRADDYFAAEGVDSVDLIKIDIEGYELPALQGMRRLLETSRPVIEMEITLDPERKGLFTSMQQLQDAFPDGYTFFMFGNHSLMSGSYELVPLDVDFAHKAQYDIVAAPREKAEQLPKSAKFERPKKGAGHP